MAYKILFLEIVMKCKEIKLNKKKLIINWNAYEGNSSAVYSVHRYNVRVEFKYLQLIT